MRGEECLDARVLGRDLHDVSERVQNYLPRAPSRCDANATSHHTLPNSPSLECLIHKISGIMDGGERRDSSDSTGHSHDESSFGGRDIEKALLWAERKTERDPDVRGRCSGPGPCSAPWRWLTALNVCLFVVSGLMLLASRRQEASVQDLWRKTSFFCRSLALLIWYFPRGADRLSQRPSSTATTSP